jgi:hypothetical protein
MYYIIYLSAGANWFSETELNSLLATANKHNLRNNITGLLLYADGNFIQLLEGEESAVQETYKRIALDQSHRGITEIASGPLETRIFPEWAMGFKSIGKLSETPLTEFLTPASGKGSLAVNLLNAFIKTARM